MSENGDLTARYIRREKQIYLQARENGGKKRSVPMPLFWKLLDAAEFALKHGYDSPNYRKQIKDAEFQDEMDQVLGETDPIQ